MSTSLASTRLKTRTLFACSFMPLKQPAHSLTQQQQNEHHVLEQRPCSSSKATPLLPAPHLTFSPPAWWPSSLGHKHKHLWCTRAGYKIWNFFQFVCTHTPHSLTIITRTEPRPNKMLHTNSPSGSRLQHLRAAIICVHTPWAEEVGSMATQASSGGGWSRPRTHSL